MVLTRYGRLMILTSTYTLYVLSAVGQLLPQDHRLHKEVLENGFTYYIYQLDSSETRTDIQLIVNAGSLQETDSQRGLAHFVEHMAFNGTDKFPGNMLIGLLEKRGLRFGSHVNAHTGFDETVYKLTFENAGPDDLTLALDVAHQWAYHVAFDSTEVAEEKGIILEEWRSKQNEDRRLSESYLPLIFRESRYADRQPIGDMNVVLGADTELLRSFYRTWYRPDLMALAIVTPLEPEMVAHEIKTRFAQSIARGHQGRQPQWRERVNYEIPIYGDTLVSVNTPAHLSSAEFSYFFIVPAHRKIDSEDAFRRNLHQHFFNSLTTGRFSKIIANGASFKNGSTSVNNFLVPHDVLSGSAQLYGDELNEGITSYWKERKRILERGFTTAEIEKFRSQYTQQLDRALHTSRPTPAQSILERIKDDYINGNVLVGLADRAALGNRLAAEIDSLSLLAFARDIAAGGNLILMLNVPASIAELSPSKAELKELLATVESGPMPGAWYDKIEEIPEHLLSSAPVSGRIVDSAQIAALDVTVWELDNGARIYFKQTDFREEYITMSAFRPGGIYALDEGSFLAAQHVRSVIGGSGAADISRTALSELLKGNSASATMVISDHREGVAASADLKDVRTMFELLYLKWTQPRVDTVVYQKARRDLLSSVRLRPDPTPAQLLNERIGRFLNRSQPALGDVTAERVRAEFGVSRILNAYKERFNGAEGFQFILVGDYDIEDIRPDVLKYIGGLPRGSHEALGIKSAQMPVPTGDAGVTAETGQTKMAALGRVHLREFGGEPGKAVVQLYFQSSTSGLHYPELLVQKVTEEVLKVRLRQRLRDENSGVYSVGTTTSSTNRPEGILRTRISFSCDAQQYGLLIAQVYELLDQMKTDPATFSQIMQNVKLQIARAYEGESQRNTFWTSELRNHLYQGYDNWLYLTRFPEMLADISTEDIAHFLRTHLDTAQHIEAVLLPDQNNQSVSK